MKIAVTYQDGNIFQHFGHTSHFKLYEIADGKIAGEAVIAAGESGHGALAGFLKAHGVDTLICGGIGPGAKQALSQEGIQLYGGAAGDADRAVSALLAGTLAYNPDVECSHHHTEDHHCHGES